MTGTPVAALSARHAVRPPVVHTPRLNVGRDALGLWGRRATLDSGTPQPRWGRSQGSLNFGGEPQPRWGRLVTHSSLNLGVTPVSDSTSVGTRSVTRRASAGPALPTRRAFTREASLLPVPPMLRSAQRFGGRLLGWSAEVWAPPRSLECCL
jgi:hypothetical protein